MDNTKKDYLQEVVEKIHFSCTLMTIILLAPLFLHSQTVVVPKVIKTNSHIITVYKDILVGRSNNTNKGTFGYSRDDKLLWKNMDITYRARIEMIDSIGNSYGASHDVLDLKSGLLKKSPLKFPRGARRYGAISNNDYIYGAKEQNSSYFMTKINTKDNTILDIPIKCKGYYSLIDIDKNILLPSDCVQRLSPSGKLLAFRANASEGELKKYSVFQIASNGNTIGVNHDVFQEVEVTNFMVSFDKNFNFLWSRLIDGNSYSIALDKDSNIIYTHRETTFYLDSDGNELWQVTGEDLPGLFYSGLVLSDNDIIYADYRSSNIIIISAISKKGKLLWGTRLNIDNKHYNDILLDQTGILYTQGHKIQTSSKGLLSGGWPMYDHDPRGTNNASAPIYLKEYPNNNDHKKVICEIDNKTIDINKLTHLSKGWHLLGNSYETKDYCPFSNIDYVYYYDTANSKFNKIKINNESTHKVIPKHSGLFVYNKYEDNLTIYYDKEEIPEEDKNIIDKEYINTLSSGWHLLGSSDSIKDMSIFKDIKDVYIYDNGKGYTTLDSENEKNFIKEYSGFWVHKK